MIAIALIGLVIGAVMGLTGAGGGVLAVPALVTALGWSMKQAAPVAMVAIASGALLGTVEGLKRGMVRYKAAALMALAGIPMASLGQQLAQRVSEGMLRGIFCVVLVIVAARLYQRSKSLQDAQTHAEMTLMNKATRLDPVTRRFVWTIPTALVLIGMGMSAGFIAGLLGVGGGFILVPLLLRFTPLSMHSCVATSLMVMALVSLGAVASAAYATHPGLHLPAAITAVFAVATMLGMLAGRYYAQRLPAPQVQRGFAALLMLVAALFAYKLLTA